MEYFQLERPNSLSTPLQVNIVPSIPLFQVQNPAFAVVKFHPMAHSPMLQPLKASLLC